MLLQWHRPRLRGGSPFTPVDDGFGGVKSSCGQLLELYPASRRALLELSDADVPVAIASRTHRAAWARQWLEMLRLEPGGRTAADVIGSSPVVIQDGPKPLHLKEIQRRTVRRLPRRRLLARPSSPPLPLLSLSHARTHTPLLPMPALSLSLGTSNPPSDRSASEQPSARGRGCRSARCSSSTTTSPTCVLPRATASPASTASRPIGGVSGELARVSPYRPSHAMPPRRQPPPQPCAIVLLHHRQVRAHR